MGMMKVRAVLGGQVTFDYQLETAQIELICDVDPHAATEDGSDPTQATISYLRDSILYALDQWRTEAEKRVRAQAVRLKPQRSAPAPAPAAGQDRPPAPNGGYRSNGAGAGGGRPQSGYSRNGGGGGGRPPGGGYRGGGGGYGPPKDGRQLLGWAKKQGIETREISARAREEFGIEGRIMDWNQEEVETVYSAFQS